MADFFKKFKEIEEQKQAALGAKKSELEIMLEKNGNEVRVVLSYNRIDGYSTGVYGDGKLLVLKHTNYRCKDSDSKTELMKEYLRAFGLNDPLEIADKIKTVHIYIGGAEDYKQGTVEAAAEIAGNPEKLRIYYCKCASDERGSKISKLREKFPDAIFYKVECGGLDEMKKTCQSIVKLEKKNG